MTYSAPSIDEHHRFLASFLFGGTPTPGASEVVWRAYLDVSRTLHGIRAADPGGGLRQAAHNLVQMRVSHLLAGGPRDQASYDNWHRGVCGELVSHFGGGGFPGFSIGQAQKWYNMALKYSLTLAAVGWLKATEEPKLRAIGHAPLDSFLLDGVRDLPPTTRLPRLSRTWSRIVDYDEYLAFQFWLRSATTCSPLDLEFHVWQRVSAKRREQPLSA